MPRKKPHPFILKTSLQLFLRVRYSSLVFYLVLFALGILFQPAFAQRELQGPRKGSTVVDDTTKQVYGPTTSHYYYEEDVFFNQQVYYPIDTVIWNFHKFTPLQRNNYLYQDLGNVATAAWPVYYQVPKYIGANPGIDVYDLYWDADKIRYFDTKSPYSNMKISLGGKGRSILNVVYSRNINPRWNFGFDYRTFFIDKQIQRRGKGDRNVRSTYYDFFTSFQSKDSTYRLFFNVARNKHQVFESGGVLVSDAGGAINEDYSFSDFFVQDRRPVLTAAESRELRQSIHLYHQYEIGRALQVYHKFDRYKQGNQFFDTPGSEPIGFFDHTEVDSAKTHDEVKFIALRNEAGIKGNLLKLFYNGYYAIRHYSMDYKYIDEDTLGFKGVEHYFGGRIALSLDSLVQLRGWIEVEHEGNFKVEGSLRSKWLEASLKENKYAPGFVQQAYRGSHDVWDNNFSSIDVTQVNGYLNYQSKAFKISPGITFTRLNNYVYFDQDTSRVQDVLPVQASGTKIIISPELRFSLSLMRHITLQARVIYTNVPENSDNAIRIPDFFVNGQLSYANIFVHGNLEVHTGVDFHWRSAYYPLGYDPVIQQFYTQDFFRSPDYPLVDVFLNAKIKRARIFVKYHNLVQTVTKQGYFPTPFYTGQASVIDFGFDWSFYD